MGSERSRRSRRRSRDSESSDDSEYERERDRKKKKKKITEDDIAEYLAKKAQKKVRYCLCTYLYLCVCIQKHVCMYLIYVF